MNIEVLRVRYSHNKRFRLLALDIESGSFSFDLFSYVKGMGYMSWSSFHIRIGDMFDFDFDRTGITVQLGYKSFTHFWNEEETYPLFQDLLQQGIIFPTQVEYEAYA